MRIAIPVDEKSIETKVAQSFGRSLYYLVYDTETQEEKFVENTAANAQGGAGIKAAQLVVDQKVEALLAPRCGQNAAEIIESAGIKIYKAEGDHLLENIRALEEGKLPVLTDIHAGFHGQGKGRGKR